MKPTIRSPRINRSNYTALGQGHGLGALMAAAIGLATATADAQDAATGEVTMHRFDAAPGPRNFFVTRTARSNGKSTWSVGVLGGYGKDPFSAISPCRGYDCDAEDSEQTEIQVVETVGTGDLMGSFTVIPALQLGLRVPVVFVNGQGLDPTDGTMERGGTKKFSLGDPMAEAKYRFLGAPESLLAAAGAFFVTAPLGHAMAKGTYIGDGGPDLGLRLIADLRAGNLFAAANAAGVYRKRATIGGTKLGSEFRYSGAVGYDLGLLTFMAEGVGNTRFNSTGDGSNGLEALLGARLTPGASGISFNVGGGMQITEGIGVPSMRVFAGALFTAEPVDRDEDGLLDSADACPMVAEDRDNYEDSDGCPDDDNDGDRFNDAGDKCPNEAEDLDGFEDTDGCPDLDNDKDGVLDERDVCRNELETKNGFKDDDGCPDVADTDSDGVRDEADKCPGEPEDTDGYEDTDGCPDLDNDKDGVPDTSDECSDEPETLNEFEDADGCPDEAPKKRR